MKERFGRVGRLNSVDGQGHKSFYRNMKLVSRNVGAREHSTPPATQLELERNLWRLNILELPHLQKCHQERQR
jgi:hypothetical protein